MFRASHSVMFQSPPSEGATISKPEDSTSGLYDLDASDPSGNIPKFTILHQTPPTPIFKINENDQLSVPDSGLDAENTTEFNFTFRVTSGSSVDTSGLLTLKITDVNEHAPEFKDINNIDDAVVNPDGPVALPLMSETMVTPSYTAHIWKNDPKGTWLNTTIHAIDPDVSELPITYTLGGSQSLFVITNKDGFGNISVTDPRKLYFSPVQLLITASDGERSSKADVTVIIHDDPCMSNRCQNGGTCTSERDNYTCSCFIGYLGDHCEKVDYCFDNPCKNNGKCTTKSYFHHCSCRSPFVGQNCTETLTCQTNYIELYETSEQITLDLRRLPGGSVLYNPSFLEANVTSSSLEDVFYLYKTNLIAKQGVDAERTQNITFDLRVRMEQTVINCSLSLSVVDINDNAPVFKSLDNIAFVLIDNADKGIVVTATDIVVTEDKRDYFLNNIIDDVIQLSANASLRRDDEDDLSTYTITANPTRGSSLKSKTISGIIERIKSDIRRTHERTTTYDIKVSDDNGMHLLSAKVAITTYDENDMTVISLPATDNDVTSKHNTITYSIEGNEADKYSISPGGIVSLRKRFDENGTRFMKSDLTVIASDEVHSQPAKLTVVQLAIDGLFNDAPCNQSANKALILVLLTLCTLLGMDEKIQLLQEQGTSLSVNSAKDCPKPGCKRRRAKLSSQSLIAA